MLEQIPKTAIQTALNNSLTTAGAEMEYAGCNPELTDCTSACLDIQSNPKYCESCTQSCWLGQICDGGKYK